MSSYQEKSEQQQRQQLQFAAIPSPTLHPSVKRMAPKPQITINIPPPHFGAPSPYTIQSAHSLNSNHTGVPPNWPPYANPFNVMYPTKAGEFMFKQFEGFKDFTYASAKSSLNVGEKLAFYIYEKFSKWSRQWFTHIFLVLVIFLYSVAGALMFVAVEG